MAIEALEGLTDEQLFSDANADEAPAGTVVADPEEAPAEQEKPAEQSQARDDHGRFATEAKPQADVPAAQEEQPTRGERIPLAEYLSEREKRQTFENELKAERERRQELERRFEQQRQPAAAPEVKANQPDPLLDPEGYATFIERRIEARILNERAEDSLHLAHRTYKAEFEEAYAAAQKQVDPVLKARMQQSRNPGETLMEWHRENKTRAEVGTDPNAYFDKRLEAYLADTANQAKVLERIRGGIQPAGNGKPPATSLPPSLTRTAAAATISADDDDISNDGLWRHANA